MPFTLLNTKKGATGQQEDYSGVKTVTVKLASHTDTINTNGIKMKDAGVAKDKVVMSIGDGASKLFNTNADTKIGSMDKTTNDITTVKSWLKDKSGAEDGKTYTQTLTWKFSD